MVIMATGGWQTKETVLNDEPAELLAVTVKLAVPVKEMFETVTMFPLNPKLIGVPFCATLIPWRFEIFSMLAVTEATQFSNVTGEETGEVIVTTGGRTIGHAPRMSP